VAESIDGVAIWSAEGIFNVLSWSAKSAQTMRIMGLDARVESDFPSPRVSAFGRRREPP
jgi:hypothetical protein